MLRELEKSSRKWILIFHREKQGTEVDIDGMLVNEKKKIVLNIKKISTF